MLYLWIVLCFVFHFIVCFGATWSPSKLGILIIFWIFYTFLFFLQGLSTMQPKCKVQLHLYVVVHIISRNIETRRVRTYTWVRTHTHVFNLTKYCLWSIGEMLTTLPNTLLIYSLLLTKIDYKSQNCVSFILFNESPLIIL